MEKLVLGKINFCNTLEGRALDVLHEALVDKAMWEQEFYKSDYTVSELREKITELEKKLKRRGIK